MKLFPYTSECGEACELTLKPVPGAENWPRRLECRAHGYPAERRSSLVVGAFEHEKPNDYVSEIAAPADIQEIGGNQVSVY